LKLVKQKILYFSEGKSDKVYEVDMCENEDLFVVNFRYGRRATNLREGTKTVFPVSYEEALQVFNKLIESKEKKGYSENGTIAKSIKTTVNSLREETILKYLQQAFYKTYTRNWKVSRIILRAGNLNMISAANLISKFIDATDQFEQYNAISVLASFKKTEYNNEILEVFKTSKFETIGGRIACAFLLKYGSEADKKVIKDEVSLLITEDVVNALPVYFINLDAKSASLLYYAYIFSFDNDVLRKKIAQLILKLPFQVNTFKSIRYIYRAAKITNDIHFFALLSKRVALSKPGYSSDFVHVSHNNWISVDEEKQKKNPSIAFSKKTKSYFNSATYKTIYDLSQKDTDIYIKYAAKILCSLSDKEDNVSEDIQYFYNYNQTTDSYENEQRCYPKYHDFPALMYILYGASERFHQQKNKWYFILEELNESKIAHREEVLPAIWNQKPNEVLEILVNGKSDAAIDFALRIVTEKVCFLDTISSEITVKLVSHYHLKVIAFISDVLEKKHADTQAEEAVLIGFLSSGNEKALQLGFRWLEKYQDNYFKNSDFIICLLLTNEVGVIAYLHQLYKVEIPYNHKIDIQKLESLFIKNTVFTNDFLLAVINLIGDTQFGVLLSGTSASKISELSNSSQITNKLFAINLAKHTTTGAYKIFKDSFYAYITADDKLLRKSGIEILAHFPDDFLLKNKQEIVSFCFSEFKEVREAIQPSIERLVKLDCDFKKSLLHKLLQIFTEAEYYEGLHENSYQLLTTHFKDSLTSLSEEQIFSFVLSKYEFAQNLGTPLFERRIQLTALSMHQLVKLADSAIFSIRKKVQTYFEKNISNINHELEKALLIFNTEWQDVIDWSLVYFEEHIKPENWTVELLLYICDHVKKEVQAFGMKMITKHFSNEKGLALLEKLQEHPTKGMQFFVSNYLKSFAKDTPNIILQLEGYFRTSLFNINTNRATKTSVYLFLEEEAVKNEAVAKMTIGLINSVLDTKIITDKSRNIDILLAIALKFPALNIPLQIKEVTNEV